jgi:hypothetical protein
LAYVFDPINNTLIDDEDKSLGNKLALNDDEFQKLLDIPGVFRASEAPQPPPKQEILDREAINRFIRDNRAEGGRINFADNPLQNFNPNLAAAAKAANEAQKLKGLQPYIDNFDIEVLDTIAQDKHGKNFSDLEGDDLSNLKRRLDKYEDFVKQNKRMPTESEARKFGRTDRDKTIMETGGNEVTEEDVRNKLIKNNKPAETFKKKVIFADKNIQDNFEAELTKRYSFPRTSAAAEAAGVLNNQQIYEKFLKPAGYKSESTRTIVNDYKKFLDMDFQELTLEQKEAKKLERDKGEKISQGGRRLSGTVDNPVHHMFPLGDQIGARAGEFTIIPKKINGQIAYANKQMKKLILERGKILDQVKIDTAFPKGLEKKLDNVNDKAEKVINNHYKKYPSHEGLLNWKKIDFVTDDVGRLLNVRQIGTIGGDYQKWTLANIDKTILDKKIANLSDEELRDFRQVIDETSVARDAGDKGFGAKEGTPIKNLFTSLKNKLDTSRMFTSRIPGGAIALAPADFILSMGAGMPLLESAASAGSYLIKDPYIGKAVNIPLAIAQDMQDPRSLEEKVTERKEKLDTFLENVTGLDANDPLYDQLKEKFSNMEAGDQPDIDPFQAAKGGRAKLNRGGGVEITPLPRADFSNGGAAGADVDFATQLEYFLTNEDAELPQLSTYKETKNPIEVFNDIIDPRNYPYYADVLARSGLRIGEFGARVLPATGKLIADAIQKGPFKIKETGNNYVQDYTDVLPSNIKGTGIFSEFLENITPTSLEKKVGLDKLIKKEEQKQIDRGSTVGPKVFADTIGLGAEVTAPIFPGLKLLRAYAKSRNLPADNVTKEILVKEIDEVLETQGMNRREFLQTTGAGATVILAKMLGFGDEVAQTAKVVEKAAAAPAGVPPYFFDLVEIIKKKGIDATKKSATQDLMNVYKYKGYEVYEDLATGQIRIEKGSSIRTDDDALQVLEYKPGQADETTKGKPADDYEEVTQVKYGDPTDIDVPIEEIEDGVDLDSILEFIKNEKVN